MSGWYKTDDFESITLNTGYSISASVSSELGVSAEVVTAKVGLGSSCTISSTASGTHKIKKKKGKYVRFVGKMDAIFAFIWLNIFVSGLCTISSASGVTMSKALKSIIS